MLPGPIIIKECPECAKTFTQMTMSSGNTFGAKLWSDTKFDAPMMMETHRCGVCPECDVFIWIEKATEVGRVDWENLKTSKFSDAKLYEYPTIGDYIKALEDSNLSKDDELYIRIKLLHLFNDHFRRSIPISDAASDDKNNKLKLIALLGNTDDNRLLKAEIHRELGEFETALAILKGNYESNRQWVADALSKLCLDKNTDVVILE